jgi:hypothetical protein
MYLPTATYVYISSTKKRLKKKDQQSIHNKNKLQKENNTAQLRKQETSLMVIVNADLSIITLDHL